jgi:type II secretory pathway component PulM
MNREPDTATEFESLVNAQSKHISSLKAALTEERRLNDMLQSRNDRLTTAAATANTHLRMIFMSMKDMATEMAKAGPEVLPLREEDVPTAKGFIQGLSDRIKAAGNGA